MDEKEVSDKLSPLLTKIGYDTILTNHFLKSLGWSFSLCAESDKEAMAIEFRRNDSIPPLFFEKISKIKKYSKNLVIYTLFEKTPKSSVISSCKELGIGIILFQNKQFYYSLKSKNFSKTPSKKRTHVKKHKPIKSMPQIWVYPCSKQWEKDGKTTCKERECICQIVKEFNSMGVPIHAHRIENEFEGHKKFRKKMIESLKNSHIFIGIIGDRYSEDIEFEIKNVFDYISDTRFILILKKNMRIDEVDKDELDGKTRLGNQKKQDKLIKFVEAKTEHLPFSTRKDVTNQVKTNLLKMIIELYNTQKVKLPFQF